MNAPIVNAVQRQLSRMFPNWVNTNTKHDHYIDFGYLPTLEFKDFYRMYSRNGMAAAAIDRTAAKTWQSNPELWQSEKPTESAVEKDIRKRFAQLRFWQMCQEADKRSMVGAYSGLILRLRDSKPFDKPVDRVSGGLDGIAEVIPAWEGQLTVSTWDTNPQSEGYGKPTMFQFNESAVGDDQQPRSFQVHPDRVMIWSDDGSVNGRSKLEAGYNSLIDAEKVQGAGGEGFWKTSRGAPVISAPEGVTPAQVAEGMGVTVPELSDAINDQIDGFQRGFDKGLLLGGMTAAPMSISLPSPEHFMAGPVSTFAASIQMPVKILIGNQSGERASTEDAREWAQTCNSRRVNRCIPVIYEMIDRFKAWGIIPEADYVVHWDDLTESSAAEKIERAFKMADINAKTTGLGDEPTFQIDEIRQAAGYEALADLGE
jgi:hypothetical protein